MTPTPSAALAELVAEVRKLKFGPYPAHGSGFVTILVEGNFNDLEDALARYDAEQAQVQQQPNTQPDPATLAYWGKYSKWDKESSVPRAGVQDGGQPYAEALIDRIEQAISATPNLFMRVNKARSDGLVHEICFPAFPDHEVIAACRDYDEACIRIQQLQRRAWARRAIEAMPPTPASRQEGQTNTDGQ